jgi:hypothetical protein
MWQAAGLLQQYSEIGSDIYCIYLKIMSSIKNCRSHIEKSQIVLKCADMLVCLYLGVVTPMLSSLQQYVQNVLPACGATVESVRLLI